MGNSESLEENCPEGGETTMNSDADTIRAFLLGLLEHFSRTVSSPSGKVDDLSDTPSQQSQLSEQVDIPPDDREGSPMFSVNQATSSTFSNDIPIAMPPLSELGEMPAVQDHFQTVLKRRLQVKIEQNPPLFPWESNLQEYPTDLSTIAVYPWLRQLQSLELPTALPEELLSGLLNRCQELITDALKPGVQLVKAVEDLFPEQPQVMNQMAGLVLANAAPNRDGKAQDVADLKAAFPDGYEGANTQQQVTLAMLAAREILDTLSVTLTPELPEVTRRWLTVDGDVTLKARHQAGTPNQIQLTVDLPQASQISLPSLGETVTQSQPGTLALTLPNPEAQAIYPLEIHFSDRDSTPLTFAIRWLGYSS